MKFANTNQLGQVVGVASAVKNIQERLAREGPVCAGQAGAGHSSPHPVLHAKVLHLISSSSLGSLRPRPRAVRQHVHVLGRQGLDSRIPQEATRGA